MLAQESTAQKDEEIIISIVKEMTESMTGAQSTRHWAEDALWFDIPPFASRGIQPALKFFDRVFGNFQSCKVDIVETDVVVNGDMGLVCTVRRMMPAFAVAIPKSDRLGFPIELAARLLNLLKVFRRPHPNPAKGRSEAQAEMR